MSLRKSPTRTPALLAANRANAQKSTGPRSPEGKARAALNALRHGLRARVSFSHLDRSPRAREELTGLYNALYAALLPGAAGVDVLKEIAARVWALKQGAAQWAASRKEREEWFARANGVCPAPTQFVIERPGWRVRVSVWVRWGRGRGGYWWQSGPSWKDRRARLHVVVTVTASKGHPLLERFRQGGVQEGAPLALAFRTKPQCLRKQRGSENVAVPLRIGAPALVRRSPGAAPGPEGAFRTVRRASAGRPVPTGSREKPASPPNQDDPISSYIASSQRDVLFWLRPENAVLSGPRLSESEDIESWMEAFVARWERQHGPIPKKDVMPHETAAVGRRDGRSYKQGRNV